MVEVSVRGDSAVFEVKSMDRLWALRSRLEIPLHHIAGAHPDSSIALGWFDRFKMLGAYVPHVLAAGTFWEDGGLVFWDVHDPANALVIELHDERYQRLVIEVTDPEKTAKMLTKRLRRGAA